MTYVELCNQARARANRDAQLDAAVRAVRETVSSGEDADVLRHEELFADWTAGTAYRLGDVLRYGDSLYRVIQAHTSQADWRPDAVSALYNVVRAAPEPGAGPLAWTAGEAVGVGDVRAYGGAIYKCVQAHTTLAGWEPPNVAALWTVI